MISTGKLGYKITEKSITEGLFVNNTPTKIERAREGVKAGFKPTYFMDAPKAGRI